MTDFAAARRMMVDGQVRTADVTDPRLLAAMLELPRERFFPYDKASLAYLDLDVAVSAPGQPVRRLLKPMVLAKLIQAAASADTDHVLDVGCGTGYSTALLTHLAASVVGLEEDPTLARQAADALSWAGLPIAKIVTGALARGWAGEGPYDAILLQGSAELVLWRCSISSRTAAGLSACSDAARRARPCFIAGAAAISAAGPYSTPRPRCCRVLHSRRNSSSSHCVFQAVAVALRAR